LIWLTSRFKTLHQFDSFQDPKRDFPSISSPKSLSRPDPQGHFQVPVHHVPLTQDPSKTPFKTHSRPIQDPFKTHSRPIQDPQNCARRAYGKVNKTPSLKKPRITKIGTLKRKKLTKTKAKEMITPVKRRPPTSPLDMMLPRKVMVQFCYRGRRR